MHLIAIHAVRAGGTGRARDKYFVIPEKHPLHPKFRQLCISINGVELMMPIDNIVC